MVKLKVSVKYNGKWHAAGDVASFDDKFEAALLSGGQAVAVDGTVKADEVKVETAGTAETAPVDEVVVGQEDDGDEGASVEDKEPSFMDRLASIPGVSKPIIAELASRGVTSVQTLKKADPKKLLSIKGMKKDVLAAIMTALT